MKGYRIVLLVGLLVALVRKEKSNIKPKVEKKEKNKEHQKPQKKKLRVIQIGAFSKEKNAKVALKKIANMGYTAIILKEDGFFKVRVKVEDGELKNALTPSFQK